MCNAMVFLSPQYNHEGLGLGNRLNQHRQAEQTVFAGEAEEAEEAEGSCPHCLTSGHGVNICVLEWPAFSGFSMNPGRRGAFGV